MARRLSAILLATAALSPAAALPQPPEDSIRYVVRRNDTLIALAARYLRHRADYALVQRRNHVRDPRHLAIGSTLVIPKTLLRGTPLAATLLTFRGAVAIARGKATIAPEKGLALMEGDRLRTDAASFATVMLANGSRVTMPSNATIRLETMRRLLLNDALDFSIAVDEGRAETSVTPLPPGKGWFRLRTPAAVSAVRGTEFRVAFDGAQKPSLTEVTQGTVAVGAPAAPAATPVEAGFGATVAPNGKLATEALLPAPALRDAGRVQIDPAVRLAFDPVAGATGYHVQIAADAGGVDVAAETRTTEPLATFDGIANGNWFVRATAVAPSGLEGKGQSYAMRRVLTGLGAEASPDGDGYRFKWFGAGAGQRYYRFQLLTREDGGAALVDEPGIAGDMLVLHGLGAGTYYWRVGVQQFGDGEMTTNWTPAEKLIIASAPD